MITLVVVPLAFLLRFSFYKYDPFLVMRPAFVMDNYARVLEPLYRRVLTQTLLVGIYVTLATLAVGYPAAYALVRMQSAWRRVLLALLVLPLTLSVVVMAFGWVVIFGQSGVVNTLLITLGIVRKPITLMFTQGALIVALVQALIPYQILALMSVMGNIDSALEEAAQSLGASKIRTLLHVLLPLSLPGILVGSTFVFLGAITAFVTPLIIGGGRTEMLGVSVYSAIYTTLNWPFGAALSFVMLVIALMIVLAFERVGRQEFLERERGVHDRLIA
jgi:putative spermidine/putrescine transport system permease protein